MGLIKKYGKSLDKVSFRVSILFESFLINFVVSGVYTVFGGMLPTIGAPVFQDHLFKEFENKFGGMWNMIEDPIEHTHSIIAYIDKKRKALGIAKARDRVMMDFAARQAFYTIINF